MNIVIVAGEVSGDLLGGKLVRALFNKNSDLNISGIGGQNMRDAGTNTLFDVSETSVVGIAEILRHYPRLSRILSTLKKHVKNKKPSLLILIDYPEFNLKLARYAKSLNIKVLFYVSPQVWAWRTERVKKIKLCVDLMAVLFPFELEFYKKENIPACLVRHPLLDEVDTAYKHSAPPSNENIKIGLLPGSRKNEIKKLLPVMIEAGYQLTKENKEVTFILPVAPGTDIDELKKYNLFNLSIEYQKGDFYKSVSQCNALAIASGTATLQAALMAAPMVIIYKISPITYKLFGHLINVDHIGLANIILGRREYTELIQNEANSSNLTKELKKLLTDQNIKLKMDTNRMSIYKELHSGINSEDLAEKALTLAQNS